MSKKYFKFDEINQFLDNEADINYFSTNQARRVAVGNMLGDFDENGFYVLDKKLIAQLIAMPKIVVDSIEGADLIRSAIKFDAFLHFMITFEDDRVKLVLLEKINFESNIGYNAGSYANMNEYVLDEIQVADRDVDKNVVYTRFNILREDQGKVYDLNALTEREQLNFDAIIKKMKYNYLAQNVMLKNETPIEKMEADYFDNILNAFDNFPKQKEKFKLMLKKAILEKINFLQINRPFFQKTINEILDNCLRMVLAKLSPAEREEIETKIRKVKEKYYKEYNTIIHMQFIMQNAQKEMSSDNMISDVISSNQPSTKVMKIGVDEAKLTNSLSNIMAENLALKDKLTITNSGEKTIVAHNPELKQFFNEFKQEIGVDVLKSSPQTFEVKDKAEVKKVEPVKEVEQKQKVVTPQQEKVEPKTENKVAAELKKEKLTQSSQSTKTEEVKKEEQTKKSTDSLIGDYTFDYQTSSSLASIKSTSQPITQETKTSEGSNYVPTVEDDGRTIS